jgi:hypothetical protein
MFEKVMVPVRFTAAVLLLIVGPGLIAPQPVQADDPPCEGAPGMLCWYEKGTPGTNDYACASSRSKCVTCEDALGEKCYWDEGEAPYVVDMRKVQP